ncbi:MAG: AI-2E family transporter [Ignavibacteriaceae bacterium]|nr:AI-2E family transporter [Ignavibacteriaceae bacterium]
MAIKLKLDGSVRFFIAVIGLTVIAIVLKELSHIFIPFVIAYFLYFLFSPLNEYLQEKHVPLSLVTLLDILIVGIIVYGLSSIVISSFMRFGEQAPMYFDKLNKIVSDTAVSLKVKATFFRHFSIQKIIARLNYQELAGGIFTSTFSLLGNTMFILFFFVFVVSGQSTIYNAIKNRFVFKRVKPEPKEAKKGSQIEAANTDFDQWVGDKLNIERHENEKKLSDTFKAITEQIQRYIILKIAINLAAGIVVWIFLSILGVEFPFIWGLFVFLFNFIPTIGSAIALALPVIMTLLEFGSITFALVIALILMAIQTLFFNLIEPNLIGKRLNLNPLLILLSVLIWGYIWGIVGMLLSVPLTAIIKIIISNSDSENLKFISDLMSQE